MLDETETPVLANLTEVLAPTHEPAPEPAPEPPAETMLKLPSGEVIPLRVVYEDAEYPVELRDPASAVTDTTADEDAYDDEDDGDERILVLNQDDVVETIFDTHGAVAALLRVTEELAATLRLHGVALNEILHALRPEPKAKPKTKTKTKTKPAKAKTKPAKTKPRK